MTDEERRKYIDEKIQAIAESVELLSQMQIAAEDRQTQHEVRLANLEDKYAMMMEMYIRLGNIVIRREERLDKLDGGGD